MTLSQEQLNAACDESRKQGLRTLVHAYKDAVRAATLAGCTEIEHGTLASDDDLKLMAEKGTYFDPQCGLVLENYMLYKDRYLGTSGYTEEGFAAMEKIIPMDHEIAQHAAKTPGLKMVFGTDAVARRTRTKCRGVYRSRAGLRCGHYGCDGLRQFARRGSARHGRSDWLDRSRPAGGHHCPGRRSL